VYGKILSELESWAHNFWPQIIADDEVHEIPEYELNAWKEESRQVVIVAYHLVLED
jgi:hypothetical protein